MNNMDNKFGSTGIGTTSSVGTGTNITGSHLGSTENLGHGVELGTGQMGTTDNTSSWSSSSKVGSGMHSSGLGSMLNKFGLGNVDMSSLKTKFNNIDMTGVKDKMRNVDMQQSVTKARAYANANPGKVLGGLAALVIGAGLLRGRTARGY